MYLELPKKSGNLQVIRSYHQVHGLKFPCRSKRENGTGAFTN